MAEADKLLAQRCLEYALCEQLVSLGHRAEREETADHVGMDYRSEYVEKQRTCASLIEKDRLDRVGEGIGQLLGHVNVER
jgi:hypothetical protein